MVCSSLALRQRETLVFSIYRPTGVPRSYETPPPVGPYSSPMPGPMVILGGWVFLMSEVPL